MIVEAEKTLNDLEIERRQLKKFFVLAGSNSKNGLNQSQPTICFSADAFFFSSFLFN